MHNSESSREASPFTLSTAVACVGGGIWNAFLFILSIFVMLGLTVFEGIQLPFASDTRSCIPDLPPCPAKPTTKADGGGVRFPVPIVQASELTPEIMRGYVARSEPVVIKGIDPATFECLAGYTPKRPTDLPTNKLLIDQYTLPLWGTPLLRWIRAYVGKHVVYMARFSGGYKGGFGHIDSFPSYNFYYVVRGRKHVNIVPRQYNSLLNLRAGYDSMFVADDKPDDTSIEWMDTLPGVYEFEVEEGDVLLFNNSACVHKFMNLTQGPEIFTMRLLHFDASPLTLRNDLFNWAGARYFTPILLSSVTQSRDTASI